MSMFGENKREYWWLAAACIVSKRDTTIEKDEAAVDTGCRSPGGTCGRQQLRPHPTHQFGSVKAPSWIVMRSIPPEILSRILDFVESKSTLFNWTLCSSLFYEIGVPHLYRHVELYDDEGGQRWHEFPHLRSLASLLLRRPHLARLVRQFTMRDAFDDGNTPRQCKCGACPIEEDHDGHDIVEVDDVFQAAIKASSCSDKEEKQWLEHISWKDHGDALIALLLPALGILSAQASGVQSEPIAHKRSYAPASAPKALPTFIYEIGESTLSSEGINFAGIAEALELQEHSLENFWLDYQYTRLLRSQRATDNELGFTAYNGDDTTPISSLAGFQTLKALRVASAFLLGDSEDGGDSRKDLTRIFPSILQILHFSHCELHLDHILGELRKLLLKKPQHVPNLRRILLQGPMDDIWSKWDDFSRLATLAKEQAVTIVAVNDMKAAQWEEFVERGWGMDESIKWAAGVNESNKFPICEMYTVSDWERWQEESCFQPP
ncbi:hypothetical protein MMC30_009306 [Trapelia coarctata]|nr:hypothetical protein [Trapelia coarctata]